MKLIKLSDKTGKIYYSMEEDCICHLFAGGFDLYEKVADICKERGFDTVYDIGCAFGHQSQVFLNNDLSYIGIEERGYIDKEKNQTIDFYNRHKFDYIVGRYPNIELDVKPNSLGVSIMCLGWEVYLYEDNTFKRQFKSLARDFDSCILKIPKDRISAVAEFFDGYEVIKGNDQLSSLIYCYNSEPLLLNL